MTATWTTLGTLDPVPTSAEAPRAESRDRTMRAERVDEALSIVASIEPALRSWHGRSATAFAGTAERIVPSLRTLRADLVAQADALRWFADELDRLHHREQVLAGRLRHDWSTFCSVLQSVGARAFQPTPERLRALAAGNVAWLIVHTVPDPHQWARIALAVANAARNIVFLLEGRQELAEEYRRACLRCAADLRAAGEMSSRVTVTGGAVAAGMAVAVVPPPRGASPTSNRAWWDSLGPDGQRRVLAEHPEWIGNLDGIPASIRSAANWARFDGEKADLERQRDQAFRTADALRWKELDDKLKAMAALEQYRGQRQLLYLDTSGLHVTAAVGFGHDVDTAKNVTVMVRGLSTTVEGGFAGSDGDMQRLLQGSDAGTAGIVWFGYEAPQWKEIGIPGRSVALPASAAAGASSLADFLDGLSAARPADPPRVTVVAHSYGSVVAGLALQQTRTPIDGVVFMGSPGIEATSAADLNVRPGQVYVLEAPLDGVADLGRFGPDPSSLPGATSLATGGGDFPDACGTGSTGHSEYFESGSASLYNIGRVVSGDPGAVILAPGLARR